MKSVHPLSLDLTATIERISSLKKISKKAFDIMLLDVANEIYDTYEYVLDFNLHRELDSLKRIEIKKMLTDMERILKQSTELLDLLEKRYVDIKNMDRVQMEAGEIEDELPDVIRKVNNYLKKKEKKKKPVIYSTREETLG
jgi:Mg2+ and Co2+ transporter CorA